MARNTKTPERIPRDGQTALGLYIDNELAEWLADYVERTIPRPSKTSVIVAALREYRKNHDRQSVGGVH